MKLLFLELINKRALEKYSCAYKPCVFYYNVCSSNIAVIAKDRQVSSGGPLYTYIIFFV